MNKQHILNEIARTAAANAGAPLGRERFTHETGIKVSDWEGKYWARWSDAIREAGLSPNVMQAAYDENFLLERYVSLVREIGKLPTTADLKFKTTRDPSFPSHNTFSRLGKKPERIEKLIAFCERSSGHADVLEILVPFRAPELEDLVENGESTETIGFVYLLKVGRYYKIGKSNSFERRSRELAIQLPEKAKTIHVIRTDDPTGIEQYWHRRFEAKRVNGEWFALDASDVKAFKRRKFM